MIKQMNEIKIPSLDDYLSSRYAFSTSKYTCEYCGFVGKNQGSMSAHYRGCIVRKSMMNEEEEDTEETNTVQTPLELPVVIETPIEKTKVVKTKKNKLTKN